MHTQSLEDTTNFIMLRYILGKYKNIKRLLGKLLPGYLIFKICEMYMYMKCTFYKYDFLYLGH